MNILFVFDVPIYRNNGGVERITDNLATKFINDGNQVTFLARIPRKNTKCVSIAAPQYLFPSKNIYDKKNITFYHNFIREHRINIVINQNGAEKSSYLFCNVPNSVKLITVNHTYPLINLYTVRESMKNYLYDYSLKNITRYLLKGVIYPIRIFIEKKRLLRQKNKLYSYILDKSDKFVLLSAKYFGDIKLATNYKRTDYKKLTAIPNINSYDNNTIEIQKKKKQILYVGRFTIKEKRTDRILRIWNGLYTQYPDWELIIVGGQNIEYENYIKRLIKTKGIQNVILSGAIDPVNYYQTASIFCLVSNYEGFGLVITEAMQHSLVPIVFNSFGAASDIIIDEENGFLIEPFDFNKFIDKLSFLMENENKREQMATKAKKSIMQFDFINIYPLWKKLLE